MAQKVNIVHVSDLSEVEITDNDEPTVSFSWDGTDYTIDLTAKEAEKFYKVVEPYITAGSKVGGRGRGTRKASSASPNSGGSGRSPEELTAIREWAAANGHEVSGRGRLKKSVLEAYDTAH